MVSSAALIGTCSVLLENQDSPRFATDPTRPTCRDKFVAMVPGCSEKASILVPSVLHDQKMPFTRVHYNAGKQAVLKLRKHGTALGEET